MPVLKPTDFIGRIVWLGLVRDRSAQLEAEAVAELTVSFAGPVGEDHGGLTRPSCSRVVAQYPKGTTIRNTRQFAVMAAEDLAQIEAVHREPLPPGTRVLGTPPVASPAERWLGHAVTVQTPAES